MMGKKVVVTGGGGFIGSSLVRQLAAQQAEITVIDNLVNGKQQNLEQVIGNQVRLEVADIRDSARMEDLLKGADIVFHLACLGVRHSLHTPKENHEVNATATLGLLALSRQLDIGRFVYVSSSEVYGTAKWAPMTEDHPTMPMTVYGGGKLAGESYTRAFFESYEYPTVVVRPFNAFGPRCHHEGDSGEVIPKFMLRCMAGREMIVFGDGQQTRDFTYVDDTARGIILAGSTENAVGHTINLGSGKEITINELADEVRNVVGNTRATIFHDEPRPGDVLRLIAEDSKARNLLDYQPEIGLREGLEHLKNWYHSREQKIEKLLEKEVTHNWEISSPDDE